MYRDQTRELGCEAAGDQLRRAAPINVADTDERALEEGAPESLFNQYLANPWEMLLPPGYMSLASMKRTLAMREAYGTRAHYQIIEELAPSGTVVLGSPERCATASPACASALGSTFWSAWCSSTFCRMIW
ncbi:MAG TPA: hypothetical protein VKC66_22700 [Xanthobacteraceae bacterium]|nr:hypothetical protein [Xanthobacteraceae bacterium]